MLLLFWIAFVLVAYVYAGYPILLLSGLLGFRSPVKRSDILPSISIIIPVHDEATEIEKKLQNVLAIDYPSERIEILVGSDGSTDGTNEIVRRYAGRGVCLIANTEQRGKSSIQNEIVNYASGEVLVLTDADCTLASDALKCLVSNLADPTVGLVTARPNYSNAEETEVTRNESLYLRYESWLRAQEGERGLLAMASGSLFAMRRSLWQPLDSNVGDDFVLPLQVSAQGFRNVLDDRALVSTRLGQSAPGAMMRLKVRIISKDLRGLMANNIVLNPFRAGPVAISLWSHKLLRWMVPYFLLLMLVANMFLLHSIGYRSLLAVQFAFYGAAVAGFSRIHQRFPWSVASSFCLVNTAALLGSLHYLRGGTMGRWKPTR
jgi:cellulose synthase/poly-beta-1,6-N-acetylglucosamine synthase-like glycosyltransferase